MRDDGQLALDRALSRLREKARPGVYALRRIRARVRNLLRPSRAWDGHHHPVLDRFPPWHGHSDGRYHHDFLGVRTGLFRVSEWDCSWDFRCRKREPTPFGHVQFHDGLLAFVNRTARSPLA